jgi:glycosyltransferase involved in cell wall biosynthesis
VSSAGAILDVVIPVMNKPALPTVVRHYLSLGQDVVRVIVSDGDPADRNSMEASAALQLARGRHLGVVLQPFNKSRCINIGVSHSDAEFVLICDADVMVDSASLIEMLEEARSGKVVSLASVVESSNGSTRDGPGIVCLNRSVFIELDGYDGAYLGWGMEDRDFLWRAQAFGPGVVSVGTGTHLSHDDDERTRNYHIQRATSREANLERLNAKREMCSAKGSYSRDVWEIKPQLIVGAQ